MPGRGHRTDARGKKNGSSSNAKYLPPCPPGSNLKLSGAVTGGPQGKEKKTQEVGKVTPKKVLSRGMVGRWSAEPDGY